MKKGVIFLLSLIFAFSAPMLSIAQEGGGQAVAGEDQTSAQQPMTDTQDEDMQTMEMDESYGSMGGMMSGMGGMMPVGGQCRSCMMMGGGRMGMMHGGFGGMGWVHMQKICRMPWFYLAHSEDLNLSEEQEDSLGKISFDMKKAMITRGAEVKVRELELAYVLKNPDFKLEDATAKLKQVEDARLALKTAMLQFAAQARDVLGPDQLKKLKGLCRPEHPCKSCGTMMKGGMMQKQK